LSVNKIQLLALFFDPGTQFSGNEKNYAMQYKNQDGMNLTPPLPSIIIIIFSPPAQSRRQEK